MGGGKKKGKAAPSKATPVPANSSIEQDPVGAALAVIQQLLSCKGTVWQRTDLFDQLNHWMKQLWEAFAAENALAQVHTDNIGMEQLLILAAALVELVAKVLSARKRPRDWKQAEYCSALCSALTAATATLKLELRVNAQSPNESDTVVMLLQKRTVFGSLGRLEVLRLTAAAQADICHVLPAAIKQKQQSSQPQQQAAQTIPQQEECPLLLHAAWHLLRWWTTIDGMWCKATGKKDVAVDSLPLQKPALQLAALLSQAMTADTPPADTIALADVTARCELTLQAYGCSQNLSACSRCFALLLLAMHAAASAQAQDACGFLCPVCVMPARSKYVHDYNV